MMVVEATKVINLTPHAVTLVNADGSPLMTIAPSGNLARVSARTVVVGTLKIWIAIVTTATQTGNGKWFTCVRMRTEPWHKWVVAA